MISPQDFFNLLSDETRLRCLVLLQMEREICVCEFCAVLESNQPKISRHLSLLRKSGLVLDLRRGQWVYYSLNDKMEDWMKNLLRSALKNLESADPYRSDFEKMRAIRARNPCA